MDSRPPLPPRRRVTMYGHAANLFPPCSVPGCTRPATVRLDDGRYMCAADALAQERTA